MYLLQGAGLTIQAEGIGAFEWNVKYRMLVFSINRGIKYLYSIFFKEVIYLELSEVYI
jgi:hypothetical protein